MSYKKIEATFWTDPKVKKLNPLHKFLFVYLFSSPHAHYSGIYYLPVSLIKEETGLADHPIRMGLTSLANGMFVVYDDTNQVVWVRNMAKYQIARGNKENLVTGINSHLKTLHKSPLINDFCRTYKYLGVSHPDGIPNPLTSHEEGIAESVTVTEAVTEAVTVAVTGDKDYAVSDKKPIAQPPPPKSLKIETDWIPQDAWHGFVEMRKKIKAPLTLYAIKLAVTKLDELRKNGHAPEAVLNQSTLNGWKSLYPLKDNTRASPTRLERQGNTDWEAHEKELKRQQGIGV